FKYSVYDISQVEEGEIIGDAHMQILLLTLKYIRSPELHHKLPAIMELSEQLRDKSKNIEYLGLLVRYIANAAKHLTREQLSDTVKKSLKYEGEVMATIEEQWKQEIEEKNHWEIVKNSLKEGLSVKTIMKITGMPIDRINSMKEKMA
ncbi:MAG: Rpn family recombination-promoting nuclease/putative transposase, partial [bacterium]|nr:Rpn family recombination-promoting nuclease/putative transposase [bacterium]